MSATGRGGANVRAADAEMGQGDALDSDAPHSSSKTIDACGGSETASRASGEIVITLPLPPKECHQNRSGRYGGLRDEIRAKGDARELGKRTAEFTQGDIAGGWAGTGINGYFVPNPRHWTRCTMDVLFRFPDRRKRDLTNYLAALKPYFDGFTLAGLWKDDSGVEDLRVRGTLDRANPGVTITIWPVNEGK